MITKKSLEVVGKKTIHIPTLTNNTKQATVSVTIVGDGRLLPLTIIFKGKHDRHITQTEFPTYPAAHHYCCQDSAWMDKQVMLRWVEEVLAPYVAMAPKDITPLLILDSYQCHMMAHLSRKFRSWALR
jgi:hypothetical protein